MAKLSSDGKYVTVEKGDTLWDIAEDHLGDGTKYKTLAAINGISNPDFISPGDKIYLYSSPGSSGSSSSTPGVSIHRFGLQADADNTLYATWTHTYSTKTLDGFEYRWEYITRDNVWYLGSSGKTEETYSTFKIPDNATQVRFKVKGVPKEEKNGDKTTYPWTGKWTSWRTFNTNQTIPKAPGVPKVNIVDYKLTVELENLKSDELDATHVEFQIFRRNDSGSITRVASKTVQFDTKYGYAYYSYIIKPGYEYQARARSVKKVSSILYISSDWTDFSSPVGSKPAALKNIKSVQAESSTSVRISWEGLSYVKKYTIEYTTDKSHFDTNASDVSSTSVENGFTETIIDGLTSGKEYFFRVRAENDKGSGGWSGIKSVIVGKKPSAPTTWSSTTTVISGEDLILNWVHNSEDGSTQRGAIMHLIIDGKDEEYILNGSGAWHIADLKNGIPVLDEQYDDEENDKINTLTINTSTLTEGSTIEWKVCTRGILSEFGEYSTLRTVTVYAPPSLEVNVVNKDGSVLDEINSFPFYISAISDSGNQNPIGYYLNIVAQESHETTDSMGNPIIVAVGESVYSKYFDVNTELMVEMSAGNVDLENGVHYTVNCVVSLDSGLTAEESVNFAVSWSDNEYIPDAEITYDANDYSVTIHPYCYIRTRKMYVVSHDVETDTYDKTEQEITGYIYGETIPNAFTQTDELQVYDGTKPDGTSVLYCIANEDQLAPNVLLSVYRREFDGGFTEIITGIENAIGHNIVDPHPALDYARYRIVATSAETGSVIYYDLPNFIIGGKEVIIQWDEQWTDFSTYGNEDELVEPAWTGSMIKLPYNIDVSDKSAPEVSLVKYIGRKRPVSYYGTQLGESSSWKVEIERDDEETLYALRRLSIWTGDVYVREPSGSGYWANIAVSFSQTHNTLTIPVTLDVVRVEGGV